MVDVKGGVMTNSTNGHDGKVGAKNKLVSDVFFNV
jgi:hypothetical protein